MSITNKKLWCHMMEKNVKRTDVIELLGITTNALSNMDNGEYMSHKNIKKICREKNMTESELLDILKG